MAKKAQPIASAIQPQANPVEPTEEAADELKAQADFEPIDRLDRVRALKEAPADAVTAQMLGGIEYFKDANGRTMRVCVADGELCKQEINQTN
ncbi:hypothetical protein [Undibacterium umbellatum]|uniref:PepSY domain-containing protein n=1 Tax=Undibacterium umbellatum TaxID=2762300 RepID=A0ABR6Z3C5_9BURK|nr:hypothetical protein [Undibacterium umbellatum]MBC3906215.1 hypothetical protein [Undibacterium umbellatum]